MSTFLSDSVRFYAEEECSDQYPDHTNRAIEANRALALSGELTLDHQNGNHTVWTTERLRIVISRCELPTIMIYKNFV